MSWKDWWTKNIYVTQPRDPDVFFHPRAYSKPKAEIVQAAQEVLQSLSGWRLEEYKENQGLLRASRAVLFPPSAQDIHIYIVQGLDGVTRLEMTSQSRGGKGDFGQNKRNLKAFLGRLDSKIAPV